MKFRRIILLIITLMVTLCMMPGEALADDYVTDDGLKDISEIQKYIPVLIDMSESIDRSLYEDDGLAQLDSCIEAAKKLPKDKVTQATYSELKYMRDTFDNLYSAYYTSLVPKDSFNVSVCYSDTKGARTRGNSGKGFKTVMNLEPGTTLSSIYETVGLNPNDRIDSVFILINGRYITFSYWNLKSNYWEGCCPSKITLHPDDEIMFFNAAPETTLGAALGGDSAMLMQYINSLKLQKFTKEEYEVEAAEYFDVNVGEIGTALGNGDKNYEPSEELTIFVSDPQEKKEGVVSTRPLTVNGEQIRTDKNGDARIRLYDEGWVFIQAIDLEDDIKGNYTYYSDDSPISAGTYHSVESGAGAWVHVTGSSHPEDIKDELIEELEDEYDKYAIEVFPESKQEEFQSAYEEALAKIKESGDIGIAYNAQQTGITQMKEAYESALNENKYKINLFRTALAKLPDDIELITEGEQSKINDLISAFNGLNEYQKSQLTSEEISKYESIINLGELPEAKEYNVTVSIKADNDLATAALNSMVDWLNSEEGRYYDASNSGTYGDGDLINKLYTPSINGFWNEAGYLSDNMVSPGQTVSIMTNYNYNAWLPVLYDDLGKTYVGNKGPEYTKVSGEDWTICDTPDSDVKIVKGHVKGNLSVYIGEVEYEPKYITYKGVEDVSYREFISYREPSGYKRESGFNVYFDKPYASFTMPYNDVTVNIVWGPKASSSSDAAANELTDAYNSYVKGNYSSEKWKELTDIYHEGIEKIKSSDDPESVKGNYLSLMASVETEHSGSVYGSVTVNISNNTCSTGPWYDETEPFITETLDLQDSDTMMTVILRALEENDYSWDGTGGSDYGITYLSTIRKGEDALAEFTGGSGSGWMGMLNNWFVNYGFGEFKVENDTLKNGDIINVVYTCDLGMDVRSGKEGISDTSMYDITMSGGKLSPAFNGSVKEYIFALDEGACTSEMKFEPLWKCFQARAYKGEYIPDSNRYYSSGDSVYLKDGDVIYVGSGDPAWPSMSGNSGVNLEASIYKITVVGSENQSKVQGLIDDLPKIKYSNYAASAKAVEMARSAYDNLNDKSGIDISKLISAEQLIAEYTALDEFKEALAEVDAAAVDDETATALVGTYEDMTENQLRNLTTAEKNKVNSLRYALSYEWSEDHGTCTASAANRFDSTDVFSETVDASVTVIREATCTREGRNKYTAVFEDSRFKTQTVKVTTPLLGHKYGEPSYTWAEDNSEVTGEVVCSVCGGKLTETVKTSYEVTKPATDTEDGEGVYTSDKFEGEFFAVQTKTVVIPASEHSYGEPMWTWAEDNSGATAAFTCASCGDQQVIEASVTTAVTDAKCTEAGETIYTATVDFVGRVYTDTKTVVIEAKGHVWDKGKVTSEATVDAEGVMTYTCTVCGATREESIPKVEPVEPPVDPAKQMGEDGTAFGKGASLAAAEKALASMKSDADPKGTVYRKLKLKQAKAAKTSIKIKWTKISGAAKYAVYAAKCGKSNKFKKVTTTKKAAYTIKKINKKALKKGTYYKFIVVALDKKGNVVSTSKIVHIATTGGKVGNHKAVTTKAKNNKVSLKVKKTFKLGAKVTAASAKLKVKSHRKLKYESSNTKIATVSSKGLIKAKKKGTCYVYVYAQNGMAKKIKVTVG